MPIVYCIECNITGEKYYGSTKSTLSIRINHHKSSLNCSSKEILLRDDYVVYTLQEFDTIEEARLKEDWYIRNNECINKQRVFRTDEEKKQYYRDHSKKYYEENKEYHKDYKKKYQQKNKEKIREKKREYYEKKKQQISEKNKEYRQENKEQFSERNKQYREQNKEQIREKAKKKVECEFCKSIGRKDDLKRHQRSKKCKQFQ